MDEKTRVDSLETDIYEKNETMKIIKNQPTEILNKEVFQRIDDIYAVKGKTLSFAVDIDIFLLGYYYGNCAR